MRTPLNLETINLTEENANFFEFVLKYTFHTEEFFVTVVVDDSPTIRLLK
jgi:hypothetical protein